MRVRSGLFNIVVCFTLGLSSAVYAGTTESNLKEEQEAGAATNTQSGPSAAQIINAAMMPIKVVNFILAPVGWLSEVPAAVIVKSMEVAGVYKPKSLGVSNHDLKNAADHDVQLALEDTKCATSDVIGHGEVKENPVRYEQIVFTSKLSDECLIQLQTNLKSRMPDIQITLE